MSSKTNNLSNIQSSGGSLFVFVYKTTLIRRLVFVLLLSFLIQPVHRAYADDSVVSAPSDTDAGAALEVEPVSVEIPLPPETSNSNTVSSEDTSSSSLVTTDSPGEESEDQQGDVVGEEVQTSNSSETSTSSQGTNSNVESESATASTTETTSTSTSNVNVGGDEDVPSTSETEVLDTVSELLSTTTASSSEDLEPILPLVHESFGDNEVRFKKDDCVQVDDGSYYCQPAAVVGNARDAVISAPDEQGDLEIFLVKNGEYFQLTNNEVDDGAPYYDSQSETMVWHQLSGETYTVQAFDFESGQSSALTSGDTNDMEPARYGDVTVWQRWVDGVWQIMLDRDGEVTQLTEGGSHHLTPSVYDGLVLWRTVEGSGLKILESYDLKTGKHTVIDDPEEAAMVNPRMVMVYEAVYDNGDRVTRGVDIETGKIISLDTLPVDLPDTLPESDATGETRALIQVKPGTKEVGTELLEPVPVGDPPVPLDPFTLVLTSASGTSTDTIADESVVTEVVTVATSTSEAVTLSDFELVIPRATSTQVTD